MTTSATFFDDAADFTGAGVDLLEGGLYDTGCSTVLDADVAFVGGNSIAASVSMGGSDSAMVGAVAQTGAAGDEAALLTGAEGIDLLAATVLPATGFNTGLDVGTPAGLGRNLLWSRDVMTTAIPSCDLSVSLILYRVEMFSVLAPCRIGLRCGGAR